MSAPLERFLARLYTDRSLLERFLASPESLMKEERVDRATAAALEAIDREGLEMAARSYERKRQCRGY